MSNNGAQPRRRGRPSQREFWADKMARVIPIDDFVPGHQISKLTGLTLGQITSAAAWIRDEMPDLPLVSSPAGYTFTTQATAIRKYNNRRVNAAFTIMRRLYTGVIRPWLLKIDYPDAKRIEKQFSRILEDVADLRR